MSSKGNIECGILLFVAMMSISLSSLSAAQSDGTLEGAYATRCAQQQDSQVCIALRDAMESAGGAVSPPKHQGLKEAEPPSINLEKVAGLKLATLTPALGATLGLSPSRLGVAIMDVDPGSGAAKLGLKRGDIILRVGSVEISDAATATDLLRRGLARPKAVILILAQRGLRAPVFLSLSAGVAE